VNLYSACCLKKPLNVLVTLVETEQDYSLNILIALFRNNLTYCSQTSWPWTDTQHCFSHPIHNRSR